MQIVAVSWVRNEEDIIESFVRHHAAILHEIIIIDNASTDETPHILEALVQEGLPLRVLRDESTTHRQGEALTEAMHKLVEPEAWILPLDADEFLRGTPRAGNLPEDCVTLLPWQTYVPTTDDDAYEPATLRRIGHRKKTEEPQFYKILIPPALRSASRIPMGSHCLYDENNTEKVSLVAKNLSLGHFPVRSGTQIFRKVHEGWQRHSANPAKKPGQNFHWERWMRELPAPTDIDAALLTRTALQYALPPETGTDAVLTYDPVPCSFDLLYTPSIRLSPAPLGVQ